MGSFLHLDCVKKLQQSLIVITHMLVRRLAYAVSPGVRLRYPEYVGVT